MAVANTLAYYITATITAVKSFIVQAPGLLRQALPAFLVPLAHKLLYNSAPLHLHITIFVAWGNVRLMKRCGGIKVAN